MILVTGGTGASQKFVKTESWSESFINLLVLASNATLSR
jgi:hypothetical protein